MREEATPIEEKVKGRKIGLFGGTFNPIHLGHLRGAEEIREAFDLQEVIFIPAAIPPHKAMGKMIEASHRLEMVKGAVLSNPAFSVSDVELRRSGKSYSIDTIQYFKEHYEGPLFFIMGRDAFKEIETWKAFQDLFSLCNFIIMTRPGSSETVHPSKLPEKIRSAFAFDEGVKDWVHVSGHTLHFKKITFLDISSTKIRELIERGESVRYLIPAEVETYVRQHGLYREKR